jgi:hypothetical protein
LVVLLHRVVIRTTTRLWFKAGKVLIVAQAFNVRHKYLLDGNRRVFDITLIREASKDALVFQDRTLLIVIIIQLWTSSQSGSDSSNLGTAAAVESERRKRERGGYAGNHPTSRYHQAGCTILFHSPILHFSSALSLCRCTKSFLSAYAAVMISI